MCSSDLMGQAISHVHISDIDSNGKTCLPGEGISDFKEIFKVLKGEGFDGAVLIETGSFADAEQLTRSIRFLKETARKT